MKFFSEWFSEMNHVTRTAITASIAAILVFAIGFTSGTSSHISATLEDQQLEQRLEELATAQPAEQPTAAPVAPATEATTQAPANTDTTAAQPDETQAPAETTEGGSANTGASLSTPAEILAYYNESANKIKTNATTVTRNWEDLHADNEYLEVPSALESLGKTLMSTFLKKDETPIVWSTKDDIAANYPVKGETFVSNATEADLTAAECTDDGTYYNIKLSFKECTDPDSTTGCGAAFNVIRPDEVYAATSVVQNFSCKYYNATIECKIEKATGNMVAATYTLPIVMQVTAKVLMTLDAQVGMTFIDDYTIAY